MVSLVPAPIIDLHGIFAVLRRHPFQGGGEVVVRRHKAVGTDSPPFGGVFVQPQALGNSPLAGSGVLLGLLQGVQRELAAVVAGLRIQKIPAIIALLNVDALYIESVVAVNIGGAFGRSAEDQAGQQKRRGDRYG